MKKPLLSTEIVAAAANDSEVSEDKAERPKQQVGRTKTRSRFNPTAVGFGILGVTKDGRRKNMDTDEVVASTNNCIQSNPRRAGE
jgi:hypothetical protein